MSHAWPVPQSAADEHAFSQLPSTHKPFAPQSTLNTHAFGLPLGARQAPFAQMLPLAQSAFDLHVPPDDDGAQVPFWQVKLAPYVVQSASLLHSPVSVHEPLLQ